MLCASVLVIKAATATRPVVDRRCMIVVLSRGKNGKAQEISRSLCCWSDGSGLAHRLGAHHMGKLEGNHYYQSLVRHTFLGRGRYIGV